MTYQPLIEVDVTVDGITQHIVVTSAEDFMLWAPHLLPLLADPDNEEAIRNLSAFARFRAQFQ